MKRIRLTADQMDIVVQVVRDFTKTHQRVIKDTPYKFNRTALAVTMRDVLQHYCGHRLSAAQVMRLQHTRKVRQAIAATLAAEGRKLDNNSMVSKRSVI